MTRGSDGPGAPGEAAADLTIYAQDGRIIDVFRNWANRVDALGDKTICIADDESSRLDLAQPFHDANWIRADRCIITQKPVGVHLAQSGDVLELTPKTFKRVDTLSLSDRYVDGTETGDVDSSLIRDRQIMAKDGIVIVNCLVAEGMLVEEPEIILRGVIDTKNVKIIDKLRRRLGRRRDEFVF